MGMLGNSHLSSLMQIKGEQVHLGLPFMLISNSDRSRCRPPAPAPLYLFPIGCTPGQELETT